jgi:hypothetical protein
MSRIRWLCLAPLLLLPACLALRSWPMGDQHLPDEVKTILSRAEQIEVVSLDPTYSGLPKSLESPPGYKVLGQTAVTSWWGRRQVVRAIEQGIASHDGSAALCFIPRHALRATHEGRTVELVLCFQCSTIRVYLDGQRQSDIRTASSPQELLDRLLTEAGVPLAPKPGPRERFDPTLLIGMSEQAAERFVGAKGWAMVVIDRDGGPKHSIGYFGARVEVGLKKGEVVSAHLVEE